MTKILTLIAALVVALPSIASATCGTRGGPGLRGPDGQCVSWDKVEAVCGRDGSRCQRDGSATPPEDRGPALTLDEQYQQRLQQKKKEFEAWWQQENKELASRITGAKEELTRANEELARAKEEFDETRNRINSRRILAGLPAEIDSLPKKVTLRMRPGAVRVWPAPRPFTSAIVGSSIVGSSKVREATCTMMCTIFGPTAGAEKPGDGDASVFSARPVYGDASSADLVITAQEEGFGNIILTDKKGDVIADIQVEVTRRGDKTKGTDLVRHVKKSADGHFYPNVSINGTAVRMVADTGASDVALTAEDTRKAGFDPQSLPVTGTAGTANGVVKTRNFLLPEVTVEGFVLRNVRASCCVTGVGVSLLGMSALGQLGVEMKDGTMILSGPSASAASLPTP